MCQYDLNVTVVACDVQDGTTPLFVAVRGSHDTIVKALVAAGANPNSANSVGVHLQCVSDSCDCV